MKLYEQEEKFWRDRQLVLQQLESPCCDPATPPAPAALGPALTPLLPLWHCPTASALAAQQALVDVGEAQRALQARLQQLAHQRAALVESKVQAQSRVLDLLGTEVKGACSLVDSKAQETGAALHQLEALSSDLAAVLCSGDELGCELQSARAGLATAQALEQLEGKRAGSSNGSRALWLGYGAAGGLQSPALACSLAASPQLMAASPQLSPVDYNGQRPEQRAPPPQQPALPNHSSLVSGQRARQEAAAGALGSTGSAGMEEGGTAEEQDFELESPSPRSSMHRLVAAVKLSGPAPPTQLPVTCGRRSPSRAAGEGSTCGALVVHNGGGSGSSVTASSSMKARYQAALAGQRERHARELQMLQARHKEALAGQEEQHQQALAALCQELQNPARDAELNLLQQDNRSLKEKLASLASEYESRTQVAAYNARCEAEAGHQAQLAAMRQEYAGLREECAALRARIEGMQAEHQAHLQEELMVQQAQADAAAARQQHAHAEAAKALKAEYSALLLEREREYSLLLEELRALKSCCSSMAPSRADTRQEGPGSGAHGGPGGGCSPFEFPFGAAAGGVLPHGVLPGSNQQAGRSRGSSSSLPAQFPRSGSLAGASVAPWTATGTQPLGCKAAGQGAGAAAQLMEPYEYD